MFEDMENVLQKSYPEQSIIASLRCIRLLAEEFPKCVRVSFRRKELEQCKVAFANWYDAVKGKLPAKYREEILFQANAEFALFEERVLV